MSKPWKSNRKAIPSLQTDSTTFLADEERVEALTKSFEEAHEPDLANLTEDQKTVANIARLIKNVNFKIPTRPFPVYLTNPTELKEIEKTFSNDKASGIDEITYRIVKNLSNRAFCKLTYIVKAVLKQQCFPNIWKEAVVVPIPRAGKVAIETKL